MKTMLFTSDHGVTRAFDWVLGAKATGSILAFDDPNAGLLAMEHEGHTLTHVVVDLDMPAPSVLAICYAAVRLAASHEIELVTIEGSRQKDGSRGQLDAGGHWTISRRNMKESIAMHFGNPSKNGEEIASIWSEGKRKTEGSLQAERFGLDDKITLPGGAQFLDRCAFDAHFAEMTKPKLFETRVLTLQIVNIEPVFEKTPPSEFRRLLGNICLALTAFFDDSSFRCTYNGHGVFFCAVDASHQFKESELLDVLKTGGTRGGTSTRLALGKLVYSLSQTKRAIGVFRSDEELPSISEALGRKRAMSKSIVNRSMRPRRVQTRLLRM